MRNLRAQVNDGFEVEKQTRSGHFACHDSGLSQITRVKILNDVGSTMCGSVKTS